MNGLSLEDDNYMTMLADMEHSWQAAVDKAMSVREGQLSAAHTVIVGLRQLVKQQESQLKNKDEEAENLKDAVTDLNKQLVRVEDELVLMAEEVHRQIEEKNRQHNEEMLVKERELEDIRFKQMQSIQELTSGARDTLKQLESNLELEMAKSGLLQKRIHELEEIKRKHEKRLQDWNRVSDQMAEELSQLKNKLQGSKFANSKLREEAQLWKKYCEKVEEERKTIKREVELEKKVLNKFCQIDGFLKNERQHRNMMIEAMNAFGRKFLRDFKRMEQSRTSTAFVSVEIQTEWFCDEIQSEEEAKKDAMIDVLKQKEIQLQDEMKKVELHVENLTQQNLTLREVIKSMKKEKENWEKEIEQVEEEARVTKLEESVKLLKNNLMNEQRDVCVWSALQDVKKEVSNLKNKNLGKASKKDAQVNTQDGFSSGRFIVKPIRR